MYDRCKDDDGEESPCAYNGPPKPLEKINVYSANMTSVELLTAMCPDFVYGDFLIYSVIY